MAECKEANEKFYELRFAKALKLSQQYHNNRDEFRHLQAKLQSSFFAVYHAFRNECIGTTCAGTISIYQKGMQDLLLKAVAQQRCQMQWGTALAHHQSSIDCLY